MPLLSTFAGNAHIGIEPIPQRYMKEIAPHHSDETYRKLRETVQRNGGDPDVVGRYIMDHIEADRAINELQKGNIHKNNYFKWKHDLMEIELFAIKLLKK